METGIHHLTLKRASGDTLRYTLAIPGGYDSGGDPLPLILALHYAGHGTPYYGEGVLIGLIGPGLHELGAIIAAPDCPVELWASPGGEQAVIDLLDHLLADSNLTIDPDRVVLTGYSLGGMGTWYIAARHQKRFSAAIPIAGKPQEDTASFDWRMPVYAINSSDDELIDPGPTGHLIDHLRDQGVRAGFIMAAGVTHFEVSGLTVHLQTAVSWLRRIWELQTKK